jgi:hypothetical protein
MKYEEFIFSITKENLPPDLNKYLSVLWYDAKGKWDIAHNLAQAIYNRDGSLLHAYLHRKEGDLANAAYWYSNADKEMPNKSIKDEWEELVKYYLDFNNK